MITGHMWSMGRRSHRFGDLEGIKVSNRQQRNQYFAVYSHPMFRGSRRYIGFPFRLRPKTLRVVSGRAMRPDELRADKIKRRMFG